MRVLHLTPEFPPVIWGGLGIAVGGLVASSTRAGITVGVLLIGGELVIGDEGYGGWHPISPEPMTGGGGQAIVNPEGVTFFRVSPIDAPEVSIRLVRNWQPDVVHIHSAWLWPTAQAIQQQTDTPIVFTVHSIDRIEHQCGVAHIDWEHQEAVIAAADRVIAISRSERELLHRLYPETLRRVSIVGNGIDDTLAARESVRSKQQVTRPNDSPLIMYCGRFVARKGIHELLLAIPQVLERAPNTRFVLVGGYGGGAEIERTWMADTLLPYRSQVHFTGWLSPDEVARWYRAADVLVVPSWYEPFGMVILEGMLYGLAIASSNIGGPAEILEQERTGILFPPQNTDALAHAILQLVQDLSLRQQISLAAAETVRRKWLWKHAVRKMRTVYQRVVSEGRPGCSSDRGAFASQSTLIS